MCLIISTILKDKLIGNKQPCAWICFFIRFFFFFDVIALTECEFNRNRRGLIQDGARHKFLSGCCGARDVNDGKAHRKQFSRRVWRLLVQLTFWHALLNPRNIYSDFRFRCKRFRSADRNLVYFSNWTVIITRRSRIPELKKTLLTHPAARSSHFGQGWVFGSWKQLDDGKFRRDGPDTRWTNW